MRVLGLSKKYFTYIETPHAIYVKLQEFLHVQCAQGWRATPIVIRVISFNIYSEGRHDFILHAECERTATSCYKVRPARVLNSNLQSGIQMVVKKIMSLDIDIVFLLFSYIGTLTCHPKGMSLRVHPTVRELADSLVKGFVVFYGHSFFLFLNWPPQLKWNDLDCGGWGGGGVKTPLHHSTPRHTNDILISWWMAKKHCTFGILCKIFF